MWSNSLSPSLWHEEQEQSKCARCVSHNLTKYPQKQRDEVQNIPDKHEKHYKRKRHYKEIKRTNNNKKTTIEMKWIGLENWQLSHGLVVSTCEYTAGRLSCANCALVNANVAPEEFQSIASYDSVIKEWQHGPGRSKNMPIYESSRTSKNRGNSAGSFGNRHLNHNTVVRLNNTPT